MPAYTYMKTSTLITNFPCVLFSVLVTTDGGGPGKVDVYDGSGVEAAYKVATLRCPANQQTQTTWKGLELSRGLYIDIVEKADYVTVEWKPLC